MSTPVLSDHTDRNGLTIRGLSATAGDIAPTGTQAAGGTGKASDAGHVHPDSGQINVILDGGGSALTTGVKLDIRIPVAILVTEWEIVADQVGSIVVDIWNDTYANFPPTVADTITGAEKPTLASAAKNTDTSLAAGGWSIAAGSWLRFNVDSISTVTRVTVALKFQRT